MQAIQSVFSILMMIGIGVFVAWKLGFNELNSAGLASLVINITLPAYMISNICLNYDHASLLAMAPGLVIPFAALGICYVLGFLAARALQIPRHRHGAFDQQRVGMAALGDDRGAVVGGPVAVSQANGAAAIDHGQRLAAQRCDAGDPAGRARDRRDRAGLDHRFDVERRERAAASGDLEDNEQLFGHAASPAGVRAAAASAASSPSRS